MIEALDELSWKVISDVVIPDFGGRMRWIKIKTFEDGERELPNLGSYGGEDVSIGLAYGL